MAGHKSQQLCGNTTGYCADLDMPLVSLLVTPVPVVLQFFPIFWPLILQVSVTEGRGTDT